MKLRKIRLYVPPRQVFMLRFLFEAYENLFFLSTIDKQKGLIQVLMADGAEKDLECILEELQVPYCKWEIVED